MQQDAAISGHALMFVGSENVTQCDSVRMDLKPATLFLRSVMSSVVVINPASCTVLHKCWCFH